MSPTPPVAFDFGENWKQFSANALDPDRVQQAAEDFRGLLAGVELKDRTFLDIGFGQGLGLFNAATAGARVIGCDINPKCAQTVERNRHFFPKVQQPIPVVVGSILDPKVVSQVRNANGGNLFEVVHSWGVLHHTGNMDVAIAHATSLVAPGGHFILAIYNRHWSSPAWKIIKHLYVRSPRWLQKIYIGIFYPIIYAAKWIVTGKNPLGQERGMNFYYDVIDWVGGYPYEYASINETSRTVEAFGFRLLKARPARVPTGCNEFIFQNDS